MATCNCDGNISQDISDYWGGLTSLSDIFGGVAPDKIQAIACQSAIGQVRGYGFDPCDPNYAEVLANEYQLALPQARSVAASTPYQNTLQRSVDVFAGQPSAPVNTPPPPQPTNWGLIIAGIAILAVGFVLVFK